MITYYKKVSKKTKPNQQPRRKYTEEQVTNT